MSTAGDLRRPVNVPRVGFGAATLGNLYTAMTDEVADATVNAAWNAGIRYFDTAPHYGLGLSEERLGRALRRRPRDEYVVSTKVGRVLDDGHAPQSDLDSLFAVTSSRRRRWDFSANGVYRSLDDSLTRLGLDRVDVALVHDPDSHVSQAITEAIPALCRLREQGAINAVGVGVNDTDAAVRLAAECDIDVVLIAGRYTLLDQQAAARLLPFCAQRGIAVITAGVFNSGLLATTAPAPGATFDYAAAPVPVVERTRAIAAVCAEHGIELPEAAVRFAGEHPAIASVLISGRTPAEIEENTGRIARADARGDEAWDALWADLVHRGLIDRLLAR